MKNLVGSWYGSQKPLWWLSFVEPDEEKPWWKFWRRAKEGEFLGVAIVHATSLEAAMQEAWNRKINPGGEIMGMMIINAEVNNMNRLLTREEAEKVATATKVLDREQLSNERNAGRRGSDRRKPMRDGGRPLHNDQPPV
jgi:hypothetical protein